MMMTDADKIQKEAIWLNDQITLKVKEIIETGTLDRSGIISLFDQVNWPTPEQLVKDVDDAQWLHLLQDVHDDVDIHAQGLLRRLQGKLIPMVIPDNFGPED